MAKKKSNQKIKIHFVWKKPSAIPICGTYRPDIEYLISLRKSATFNGNLKECIYSKVLEHKRELDKVHPTMKPVAMLENQIKICSNKGDIVLDFFGGSGSTMIACEKTGRRCRMIELDIIIHRWEQYTGNKANLLNG